MQTQCKLYQLRGNKICSPCLAHSIVSVHYKPQEPTPDLEPEALSVLSSLCLAQAQEMVVQKAVKDSMKDNIVAKLAGHADDLFAEVMKVMQKESVRTLWDKEWLALVSGKQVMCRAESSLSIVLVSKVNVCSLLGALALSSAVQSSCYRPCITGSASSTRARSVTPPRPWGRRYPGYSTLRYRSDYCSFNSQLSRSCSLPATPAPAGPVWEAAGTGPRGSRELSRTPGRTTTSSTTSGSLT